MEIIRLAENEVRRRMESFGKEFSFHNMDHALQVRKAVESISKTENIHPEDLLKLQLAALFHDVGYDKGAIGHESRGAEICSSFLEGLGAMDLAREVPQLILSTQSGVHPQNHLEQLLCDADLSYLGTDEYYSRASLLRHEMYMTRSRVFTEEEWLKFNLSFFRSHRYLTSGAKSLFAQKKKEHEIELEEQLKMFSQ